MPKPSDTWKQFERWVADYLSPFFGVKLFRNPLSGANNRRDNGEPRRGDVVMPEGIRLVVEAKYRNGHSFHRFFDEAQHDAELSNIPLCNVILFTREKNKRMVLATISTELLSQLLEVARDSGKLDTIFGNRKQ